MSRGWWRANRLWLPLVPVALVAMLAAASYHVKTFWFDDGLHRTLVTAKPGHVAAVDIPYEDTAGKTAYRFRVRVDKVTPTTTYLDSLGDRTRVQAGVSAYRVRLGFSADPSVALSGCQLTVVDAAGHQYDVNGLPVSQTLCVPDGHEGPSPALYKGAKRGAVEKGHQRPRTWTTSPVVLVPTGARPVEVRVWFARPDYVSLRLPR
ncbi:hypothetical protein D9V37_04210 [Nocardioides mangrovicus]|uniref:Uncharacterized protein n=1 Tax=Nocardioides mangrovicus TaxID=2478913 RepID=A0A3L8P8P9_9ACTN|nr:hypothetical protein [Nocardioides mangrovicus]RLV51129.1 hypothetical protein D9V37_04210 [Nocardioides mangrovicus]